MPGNITSIKTIKEKLAQKNYAPRKSLGQNFLVDQNILHKIVGAGNLAKNDLVLEIGPGLGALTEVLLERAKQVIAVEYDVGLFTILQERLIAAGNLLLLNQDFLEMNLSTILESYPPENYNYKVVANLPYYITTPIIFKLIESKIYWESMVFLVQKEVAERLSAGPGTKEYSSLTVMLNFYGRAEKIGNVPKTVFYPAPKVDSAIVRITPDNKRQVDQEIYPYLRQVVQASFGQRRKTILNALGPLKQFFESKEAIADRLRELRIDPQRRGETLTLPEFLNLAMELRSQESRRCINDFHQPN